MVKYTDIFAALAISITMAVAAGYFLYQLAEVHIPAIQATVEAIHATR